jgi:hypothetical protein
LGSSPGYVFKSLFSSLCFASGAQEKAEGRIFGILDFLGIFDIYFIALEKTPNLGLGPPVFAGTYLYHIFLRNILASLYILVF